MSAFVSPPKKALTSLIKGMLATTYQYAWVLSHILIEPFSSLGFISNSRSSAFLFWLFFGNTVSIRKLKIELYPTESMLNFFWLKVMCFQSCPIFTLVNIPSDTISKIGSYFYRVDYFLNKLIWVSGIWTHTSIHTQSRGISLRSSWFNFTFVFNAFVI